MKLTWQKKISFFKIPKGHKNKKKKHNKTPKVPQIMFSNLCILWPDSQICFQMFALFDLQKSAIRASDFRDSHADGILEYCLNFN